MEGWRGEVVIGGCSLLMGRGSLSAVGTHHLLVGVVVSVGAHCSSVGDHCRSWVRG